MRKRLLSLVLMACMVLSLLPTVALALTAQPSTTSFVMNGASVSVPEAYAVNGNNYLQLRSIAVLLNGTAAQFNVGWDGTFAVIETAKPYTGTSNPAALTETADVRKSDTKFRLDGALTSFANAYYIGGNSNYLQLREVAEKLSGTPSQFNVYWDNEAGKAVIAPGEAYTGNPPAAPSTETPPAVNTDNPGAKTSADKLDMTHIPAGSFTIGMKTTTISQPFYMGTFEVTQEQYQAVMGNNPSLFQGSGKIAVTDDQGTAQAYDRTAAAGEIPSKRPVDRVSWYNAIVFCNKLSIKEGLTPAYRMGGLTDPKYWGRIPDKTTGNSTMWDAVEIVPGSTGYRLPTLDQWEYAYRAGSTKAFKPTDAMSWNKSNSGNQTHQVGLKTPTASGLYDMDGNITEWVWDWRYSELPLYSQTDASGSQWYSDDNKGVRSTRGSNFSNSKGSSSDSAYVQGIGMFVERNELWMGFRICRPDAAAFPYPDKPTLEGMTWIPGGTYVMGSPESEPGRTNAEKQVEQTVEGFYMGTCEVTQKQYLDVTGKNPSKFKRGTFKLTTGESWEYHPVGGVSWYDTLRFCNLLSIREGLTPAYSIKGSTNPSKWGLTPTKLDEAWDAVEIVAGSNGYRLPTAAQWEYACRAGTTTVYNTGLDTMAEKLNSGVLNIVEDPAAWRKETSTYRDGVLKTHEVGFLPPNAFGLRDMIGNVSEWCWDATREGKHTYKGGSYGHEAGSLRSAIRFHTVANEGLPSLGFRVVRPYSPNMPEKPAQILGTDKPWTAPLIDGWYKLKLSGTAVAIGSMQNGQSNQLIASDGSTNPIFYIQNLGDNIITIKLKNGGYLGVMEDSSFGDRVGIVKTAFKWYITFETGGIRPASDTGRLVVFGNNPAGGGTYKPGAEACTIPSALPNKNKSDPSNSKFTFYPVKEP